MNKSNKLIFALAFTLIAFSACQTPSQPEHVVKFDRNIDKTPVEEVLPFLKITQGANQSELKLRSQTSRQNLKQQRLNSLSAVKHPPSEKIRPHLSTRVKLNSRSLLKPKIAKRPSPKRISLRTLILKPVQLTKLQLGRLLLAGTNSNLFQFPI